MALCFGMGLLSLGCNNTKNISNSNTQKEYIKDVKYNESIDKMKKDLNKSMEELNIPDINILVMENGNIIYEESFGKVDNIKNIKLTKDTIFNMGSISKLYVTASILKLQDENKLDLDEKLINYIPEFKMADERYKDITVRMLLNHSSGLPGVDFYDAFLVDEDTSENHTINNLKDLEDEILKSNPGEYSVYCNEGFNISQYLVEKISEKTYEEYLNEKFFKPMNIEQTYYSSNKKLKDEDFARSYDQYGNIVPRELMSEGFMGTGGLASTAEDIAIFVEKILSEDEEILSKESIKLFKEDQGILSKLGSEAFFNGLGWDSVDSKYTGINIYSKSGGTMQYQTQVFTVPDEKLTVVGLSTMPSQINPIVEELTTNILKEKEVLVKNNEKIIIPKEKEIDKKLLDYTGNYYIGMVPMISNISINNNVLTITMGRENLESHKYIYREDGYFWSEEEMEDNYERIKFKEIDNKIFLEKNNINDYYNDNKIIAQKVENYKDNSTWSDLDGSVWLQTNLSRNNIYSVFAMSKLHVDDKLPGYVTLNEIPFKVKNNNVADSYIETVTNTGSLKLDNNKMTFRLFDFINSKDIPKFEFEKINGLKIKKSNYSNWYLVDSDTKLNFNNNYKDIRINVYNKEGLLIFDNLTNNNEVEILEGAFIMISGEIGKEIDMTEL